MAVSRTFDLEIEGIGAFVFRHRTMRDQYAIEADTSKILGGPTDDNALYYAAIAFATLSVLTVQGPDDWDLEGIDPLDPDATQQVFTAYRGLRAQEETFRAERSRKR